MSTLLAATGLEMRFGAFRALEDVSFSVAEGETLGIVGPNGAGKTTLLNCVSGLYRPTRGSIHLRGTPIRTLRPHQVVARGVARTFQHVEQLRATTVEDLALMGRHQRFRSGLLEAGLRLPRAQREEREHRGAARQMLERMGIAEYAGRPLETVPYGVRKLADLARALCSEPTLLLLDEPSAGMGDQEKRSLHDLLVEARGMLFQTLVVIDHDVRFVRDICERCLVLDFGRRIAEGPTEEVLRSAQVVEAYLGSALGATDTPTAPVAP